MLVLGRKASLRGSHLPGFSRGDGGRAGPGLALLILWGICDHGRLPTDWGPVKNSCYMW